MSDIGRAAAIRYPTSDLRHPNPMIETLQTPAWILIFALTLDAVAGDARPVFNRIPHPVVIIGNWIRFLERRLNRPERSDQDRLMRGGVTVILVLVPLAALGLAVEVAAERTLWAGLLELILLWLLVAQRGLSDHVRAVATGLSERGLQGGRDAVSHIVGRDPDRLDEAGVSRAAIESCAENFSDGVVAPVFWYVLAGPAGVLVYKGINTLDSMIGYRDSRYLCFGRIAARLDDIANFVPARLAGGCLVAATLLVTGPKQAILSWRTMLRDARLHASPNAGWQEAAMAGALNLRLAGPRRYGTEVVADPYIGSGQEVPSPRHIHRALKIFLAACILNGVLFAGIALLI